MTDSSISLALPIFHAHHVYLSTMERYSSSKACNLVPVLSEHISENGIASLSSVSQCLHSIALHNNHSPSSTVGLNIERTGGISFGSSTSLVNFSSPLSSGHLRSTCPTCSHKSASWLMRVIRPYFTWRWTFAPSSTFSVKLPLAEMLRVLPLSLTACISLVLNLPQASTIVWGMGLIRLHRGFKLTPLVDLDPSLLSR